MKILILSDIHGNQSALRSVLDSAARHPDIQACILLGDLVDYGMHSNEVLQMLQCVPYHLLCNIHGNHEAAILGDTYDRFSSGRGRDSAKYTRSILTPESWNYLHQEMSPCGKQEFTCCGKKCLAVHGSLEDIYWKSIRPDSSLTEYADYDYVFSGHSHLPHLIEKFYPAEDIQRRNRKKTIFINPGSVGQPRNLNPMAQFALLDIDTEQVTFEKAAYDIDTEQASYQGQVDDFYRERLTWGI